MIRAGIGGWTFEPWRGTFYPQGLPQKRELEYASRKLSTIEINGTFYRTQTPASFTKWRDETPDDFVFSVKAPRYATNKKVLGEAGESIDRFMQSGLSELGDKLGPVLWQFAATKKFAPDDFDAFLALLPRELDGTPLRHALEVRHESFKVSQFYEMARNAGAAIVLADSDEYPFIDEKTADFTYARLMRTVEDELAGYAPGVLAEWSRRAKDWASGNRDVFIYFISGAKVRAPAAAEAFLGIGSHQR